MPLLDVWKNRSWSTLKMEKDGRSVLVVRPYDWYEFFTPEELQEMSQPEFMDDVEAIVKEKM